MTTRPRAVVLGVAQDGGHPQPGCQRDCCCRPDVRAHLTTCVAIVEEDKAWLLDAGPDFRQHISGLTDMGAQLAGILLTHGHIGHYSGLMYLGRETMNTSSLPVWAPPRLVDFLKTNGPWDQLVELGNVDLNVITSKQPVHLSGQITVDTIAVPRRDEYSETVGFKVNGPQFSFLYVPDTDSWDDWETPIESHVASVDVALLDATFFDDSELPGRDLSTIGHPFVVDSIARFAGLADRERAKIRFTHLNHSNPLLDPASDQYVQVVRAGLMVAAEGDIIEL